MGITNLDHCSLAPLPRAPMGGHMGRSNGLATRNLGKIWHRLSKKPRIIAKGCFKIIDKSKNANQSIHKSEGFHQKNPWNLPWKGLNLYRAGPQNSNSWGVRSLREPKKNPPRFGSCVVWLCVFLACWEQIFVEENKIMATSKHFRYHPNRGILKPIFQLYGYGLCKGKPKIPKIAGKSQDSYILKGEPLWWFNVWMPTKTCWWFQPIWKILVKMGIFPK